MLYLVDTGVLLRLFNRSDPQHANIRLCVRNLKLSKHRLAIATQNVAEFWNVSTRPQSARGGYGLTIEQTDRQVRILERICEVLPDSPNLYLVWRKLVVEHKVSGVQVHDARLVAWMETQAITHLLTLNGADFARYKNVVTESPESLISR